MGEAYIQVRSIVRKLRYITKQAEQEIYLIAQKKLRKKPYTPSTSQALRWCPFLSQWHDEL